MPSTSHLFYINTNISTSNHKNPLAHVHNCIYYIVEGYGFLKIKDRVLPVCKGQAFFVAQGCSACYWSGSKEWKFIWLNFDGWNLISEILQKTAFNSQCPICDTSPEQEEYFYKILSLKQEHQDYAHYQTMGLLLELFSSYIKTYPSTEHLKETSSFKMLLSFINNNLYRKDLNTSMLVAAAGRCRSTLYEWFHKEMNSTPGKYIYFSRISKARHMLATTNLPIKYVANAVGYEDPLYFSHVFHKNTGLSPTKFRQKHRTTHTHKQ